LVEVSGITTFVELAGFSVEDASFNGLESPLSEGI
jgi:hypothetical protein